MIALELLFPVAQPLDGRLGDLAVVTDIVDPPIGQSLNVVPMCGPLGCSLPAMGPPVSQGGDIIRLLNPEADAAIASLFDPSIWTRDDRWMLPPANSGLDVRLPIPAEHSAIYLIYQP